MEKHYTAARAFTLDGEQVKKGEDVSRLPANQRNDLIGCGLVSEKAAKPAAAK